MVRGEILVGGLSSFMGLGKVRFLGYGSCGEVRFDLVRESREGFKEEVF